MEKPSKNLPPLYECRSIPFEMLSPDEFEKCVFACFLTIQSRLELRVDGSPSGSGDGGFDVYGVDVKSNRTLCIQCKRQAVSLGLPLLAHEIAKVALNSRLEGSDVGVHYFICTGGVTQELRRIIRGKDRSDISNEAQRAIRNATKGELFTLRERLVEKGEEAEEVIGSYVKRLDRLIAWDIDEFDAALSPDWDEVVTVIDRYFRLATTVREHPRALFDRDVYQERSRSFSAVVRPLWMQGDLPAGLVEISGADPVPKSQLTRKELLNVESLAALKPGELALVVGEGGAGKTTLLKLIRAEVAKESSNSALSIIISCAKYEPGGLDTAVHAQLRVKSGHWRSIPDKIQILCDGINEAPTSKVRALFAELDPLLASKIISCIITSREDTRAVRIVLPAVPCAALHLLPLTPSRVRAIAQHELPNESDVVAFEAAHRALATRAEGRFMWTPFAVHFALGRWKKSQQIGNTLGELLDEIVIARADRDLEITSQEPSSEIPRASVLAIAAAMAFEMLVVEGHAARRADMIGRTFKEAMLLCSDVLGADGLNSVKLFDLLRKHDLVQQTRDESFQWRHQLVAGALAARHLASRWKQHLKTLEQTVADDAWVFATRYVVESELDDYLRELFRADVLLGARATAELPLDKRDRSLQFISKALEPGQPEELRVSGLFALARVGTEAARALLYTTAEDRHSDIGYVAARALASSGDRLFLLKLLEYVDQRRVIGWMLSGGEISIWEAASITDRIAIARERLRSVTPGEPVNESLMLVGRDTSPEDLLLLEMHLRAARDIIAWRTALVAIKNGDADRGQRLFEEALMQGTTCEDKAQYMSAAHKMGLLVDAEAAFFLLMDLLNEESSDQSVVYEMTGVITDILGEVSLPEPIRSQIEEHLPLSSRQSKSILWQIATRVESPSLALTGLDTFDNDPENAGMAANFFLAHETLRSLHHDALQAAIEQFLTDRANWFTIISWRILELASALGLTPRIAELIHQMIRRLSELSELVDAGTLPTFDKSEEHLSQGFTIESAKIILGQCARYIVSTAVTASKCKLLPSRLLLKFLQYNLKNVGADKEIASSYREMDSDLLDDELESVRDRWVQRANLEILSEFGLTDRRLELLRAHLKETYCHPAGIGYVKRSLEKCWNTSTCAMVVETIAHFECWPEEWHQFFWEFVDMVGRKLTNADRSIIEQNLALAKTDFARRILNIWHQASLDSRVGLSRLNA